MVAGKKARVTAKAAFAPEVRPSRPGSAKGFLVIPCMIAPDIAKAEPTIIAATSRGRRISRIIFIESLFWDVKIAFHTSTMLVSAAPKMIAKPNIMISRKQLIINLILKCREEFIF